MAEKEERKEEKLKLLSYLRGRLIISAKVKGKDDKVRTYCGVSSLRQKNKAEAKSRGMTNKQLKKFRKKQRREEQGGKNVI